MILAKEGTRVRRGRGGKVGRVVGERGLGEGVGKGVE